MKISLQVYLALLALGILYYAVPTLVLGVQSEPATPIIDNQIRYLAGLLIGFSALVLWTIPNVEEKIIPLRICCAGLMLAGLGRLVSLITVGPGAQLQTITMVMELASPFLLIVQHFVRREVLGAQAPGVALK